MTTQMTRAEAVANAQRWHPVVLAARDYLNAQQTYRNAPQLLGYVSTDEYRMALDEARKRLIDAEVHLVGTLTATGYLMDELPERCEALTPYKTPSPHGPYARCGYFVGHRGLHSWDPSIRR